MQPHIKRNRGSQSTTVGLLDLDASRFRDQRPDALLVEVRCCADGRVPREGEFCSRGEDVEGAFGVVVVVVVDEDCFGEVEFFGDGLFLGC